MLGQQTYTLSTCVHTHLITPQRLVLGPSDCAGESRDDFTVGLFATDIGKAFSEPEGAESLDNCSAVACKLWGKWKPIAVKKYIKLLFIKYQMLVPNLQDLISIPSVDVVGVEGSNQIGACLAWQCRAQCYNGWGWGWQYKWIGVCVREREDECVYVWEDVWVGIESMWGGG